MRSSKPATTVGRATVERLIAETEVTTRKYPISVAAVLLGVVALDWDCDCGFNEQTGGRSRRSAR
jgi:hypothetical protein